MVWPAEVYKWLQSIEPHKAAMQSDQPNYFAARPDVLCASSQPIKLNLGSGDDVFEDIFVACESANYEVIIVTCFWKSSNLQKRLVNLLERLSAKAILENHIIHVRICLSSRSLAQKLFQTSSLEGKTYTKSEYPLLGLPLDLAGIDLVVKSVFVRPFSVMHPKFVLIDRQRAFMPSCNISSETWFEGCIEMSGSIVEKVFEFWESFWGKGEASFSPFVPIPTSEEPPLTPPTNLDSMLSIGDTPTVLLPSPHHRHNCPRLQRFWVLPAEPPKTPLNVFLSCIFQNAGSSIFIQTPNVTCGYFLFLVEDALSRGVNVHIITNRRMMALEQLVTAKTLTYCELRRLRRNYRKLVKRFRRISSADEEGIRPGALKIQFYKPKDSSDAREPVKTHIKLAIVDEEIVVMGSGNMDHASWYTSQELGIAFFSRDLAVHIKDSIQWRLREGRLEDYC